MDITTPRVNSSLLPDFIGQVVRISGKLISVQDDAVIESTDGGQITVLRIPDSLIGSEPFLEVIGKVENETTVREMSTTNFGENYDLSLAQAVVEISNNPAFRTARNPCF
ncbi:hypothetical protein CROQUDRAFT_657445 [Cronartium quercuum f. sp. fusiforme G11]|uniref:Replication factor A protein 3 n=1 Tax=Cronartium quercuum f. sp. fusiforme G11 TaxID=708437 RepID=A0A9P6NI67_9BASI|nr:hypothetical protein CROQUDRAFT_657445 [Cronartium quercuum f. sp. fusiforme G11]